MTYALAGLAAYLVAGLALVILHLYRNRRRTPIAMAALAILLGTLFWPLLLLEKWIAKQQPEAAEGHHSSD